MTALVPFHAAVTSPICFAAYIIQPYTLLLPPLTYYHIYHCTTTPITKYYVHTQSKDKKISKQMK